MSYNSAIPQATSTTIQSQQQIRANFQIIASVFANNHFPISNEFEGKHRVLTMRAQLVDPATSATQTAFYNKLVSSVPQLFFRPNNSQTPIQLTYDSISTGLQTVTPPVYKTQQYSFVAGPFVIYGGKISNATNGQTVVLTPTTTLRYVGLVTANSTSSSATNKMSAPINITGSQFDIALQQGIAGTRDIYYLAIGQP